MLFTLRKHVIHPFPSSVLFILIILCVNTVCYCQQNGYEGLSFTLLDEDAVLEKLEMLSQENQFEERNVEWISINLPVFAQNAARLNSEKIKDKLLDFPVNTPTIECMVITNLRFIMGMEGVMDYIYSQLSNENSSVQKCAARAVLTHSGDLELVEKIVRENEMYAVLGINRVAGAIPILQDALENGSWNGKINAGYALRAYGFPNAHKQAAEDILQNAPVSNHRSILRPVYMAITIAGKEHLTYLAPEIYRFTVTDNILVSGDAVSVLMMFVVKDFSSTARTLLESLVEETSNETLKKRVLTFFEDQKNQKK